MLAEKMSQWLLITMADMTYMLHQSPPVHVVLADLQMPCPFWDVIALTISLYRLQCSVSAMQGPE